MPRRHRAFARICPGAEETAVHCRSPAKSGYCRTELPLHQRGAGRSPEGINAAGSWIRTNFGEHGLSRYLSCTTADPPKCSVFLNWYCFDPLSQLTLTAPLLCKGSLGAVRIRAGRYFAPYPVSRIPYLISHICNIRRCTYAVSQEKRA